MSEERIQDWTGKVIGRVETQSNGNKVLRDFQGRKLGSYRKDIDTTFDFSGRKVGKGDILLTLLR